MFHILIVNFSPVKYNFYFTLTNKNKFETEFIVYGKCLLYHLFITFYYI